MDWPLLYDLVSDAVKIPLVATGIGGLIGATIGSIWTHHFTKKRELEKLVREKAEQFIFLLYQIQYKVTEWRIAIGRQTELATHEPVARPTVLLLDLNQADTLQALYFPVVRSHLETMEDAIMPYIDWLETQWKRQAGDFINWRAQFDPHEGEPLYNAYATAFDETIAAVRQAVPEFRALARTLARTRKR